MADGPGKYDDLCTYVREQANAVAAVVIVHKGKHGGGFSCQTSDPVFHAKLPAMLEHLAAQIRADNERALRQVAQDIKREFGFEGGDDA